MRLALRGFAAVAAALAAGVLSGSAQESFFNERFCTRSTSGNEDAGPVDCSFHTWQQCIASALPGRYVPRIRGGKPLAPKTSLSSKSAIAREAWEAFGLVATSIALIALGNNAWTPHAD